MNKPLVGALKLQSTLARLELFEQHNKHISEEIGYLLFTRIFLHLSPTKSFPFLFAILLNFALFIQLDISFGLWPV